MNSYVEVEPVASSTAAAEFPWAHFRLPPFSQSATRILSAVNDENTSMRHLSNLISSDPALTYEVLIIANSALLAQRHPVTNVMQATLLLGTRTIRGVCLTVAVRAYLGKSINHLAVRGIWRHTLACALIAEELADTDVMDKGTAYTGGIVHEMGRFALAVIRPAEYAALLDSHCGSAMSLLEGERELFGFDHIEAGRHLIAEWKLPVEFEAMLRPQGCERPHSDPWQLGELIHMSCCLADTAGFAVFPGCEVTPYEELLEAIPIRKRSLFHSNVKRLSADLGRRIDAIESV